MNYFLVETLDVILSSMIEMVFSYQQSGRWGLQEIINHCESKHYNMQNICAHAHGKLSNRAFGL